VKEKGNEIEGEQQIGQVLFSVAEIMFGIIPFRFQRIVVFILYFPATSPHLKDRHLHREIIAKDVQIIASEAGITVPENIQFLLVGETGVGPDVLR